MCGRLETSVFIVKDTCAFLERLPTFSSLLRNNIFPDYLFSINFPTVVFSWLR